MAATVLADPYQGLIRKIGYSVGLEMLVDRVKKVVSLYVKDRSISAGAFRDLVENEFGRKNAAEHFANFYSTLNLLRVLGRDDHAGLPIEAKRHRGPKALEPLYQLDSLSILRRLFGSQEDKYDTALEIVLTQCLIEADGDIFPNGLLSDFRPEEMERLLETMVLTKRRHLNGVMRAPGLLAKVYQVVDIKNESAPDRTSRLGSLPQGRFGRRTEPLDTSRRTSKLTSAIEGGITIPADYLEKVSKTRKGWAQDLGLFQAGEKTERGRHLLEVLERSIVSTTTQPSAALFWGYTSELQRIRVKPSEISACDCEAWDLLGAIASSFSGRVPLPPASAPKGDELFTLLRRIYDLYREGYASKELIRNSLPLYVAEPVLAGWCVAETRRLPDLGKFLEEEYKKEVRRVQPMHIRGTAGGLFFTARLRDAGSPND